MEHKLTENYWNNKILQWEKSYFDNYSNVKVNLLEVIASNFRKPLIKRKENFIKIIKDRLKNKIICELGCGSGDLSKKLLKLGAKKYIGLDISINAIILAKNKYAESKKLKFIKFDLANNNLILPQADIYFGLGFIDYLTKDEVKKLIEKINSIYVFSFPEKKINLMNIIQYLYLKIAGCPKFYKFDQKDFEKLDNLKFVEYNNQKFIKNF